MDRVRLPQLLEQLYSVVSELEAMFGRHFTPDGHMVGSLGEALAAHHYGLELLKAATPGCDALKDGKQIEIKATQGSRVAFRCEPQYLIVLRLNKDGSFEEVYNGKGQRVWKLVAHKRKPSNGQYQVSLAALRKLAAETPPHERIQRVVL